MCANLITTVTSITSTCCDGSRFNESELESSMRHLPLSFTVKGADWNVNERHNIAIVPSLFRTHCTSFFPLSGSPFTSNGFIVDIFVLCCTCTQVSFGQKFTYGWFLHCKALFSYWNTAMDLKLLFQVALANNPCSMKSSFTSELWSVTPSSLLHCESIKANLRKTCRTIFFSNSWFFFVKFNVNSREENSDGK